MIRRALVGIAVLVSMVVWTSGPQPAGAVSWDVPDVAYISGTLPANSFTDELPFTCISRQDPLWGIEDGWLSTAFCYTGDPPFQYVHGGALFTLATLRGRITTEATIDGDGAMELPVADCVPFQPRLYVALVLEFQRSGDPSGEVKLVEDNDPSGDCSGDATSGTLTIEHAYDREDPQADWDEDGCPDYYELGHSRFLGGLSNPFFNEPGSEDECKERLNHEYDDEEPPNVTRVDGLYGIWGIEARAGKDAGGGTTAGAYYYCIAHVKWDDPETSDDVTVRPHCYVDKPGVPVNPMAGPDSGDGEPGVPPPLPEPWGDALLASVSDEHAELTGSYDPNTYEITVEGCFDEASGLAGLGLYPPNNTYVEWAIDVRGGWGTMLLWSEQNDDCAGSHTGDPVNVTLSVVVGWDSEEIDVQCEDGQPLPYCKDKPDGPYSYSHDTDHDGCPDKAELGDSESDGGLRDPFNRWDYFDSTMNGQVRVNDILKVVGQYYCDEGTCPDYTKNTDRTAVIGANPWNLGPPNGQQRVDDILGAVKTYFHDCPGGDFKNPDDEPKW